MSYVTTSSPCGACKFLRRKCASDCIFAPYFCSETGPARFAAIHKVFGASNVSKMLLHVPVPDRCEAVVTIAYEAQARIRDPVYGCVSHVFALQQQVAYLQAQLMQLKAQMLQSRTDQSSRNAENQYSDNNTAGIIGSSPFQNLPISYMNNYSVSPQSSFDSTDHHNNNHHDRINYVMQDLNRREKVAPLQLFSKKRPSQTDLSELQALAFRMMKNENDE